MLHDIKNLIAQQSLVVSSAARHKHKPEFIEDAVEIMSAAYDAGVNFFDNAENYAHGKSEEVMGAALKKLGWRRGSYLVSTKLFWGLHDGPNESNTLNRKYLLEGMDPQADPLSPANLLVRA